MFSIISLCIKNFELDFCILSLLVLCCMRLSINQKSINNVM